MDTGIGDRGNTGRHLHQATKVRTRDQMARPTDQHQSAISQSQPESCSETLICSLCYYATQPVYQLVMWEPKVKGTCGMHWE